MFKNGELVNLKSGSPDLTVSEYHADTHKVEIVYWTDEIGVTSVEVPSHVLKAKSDEEFEEELSERQEVSI